MTAQPLLASHFSVSFRHIRRLLLACIILSGHQASLNAAENDKTNLEPEIKVTNVDLSTDPNTGAASIRFHVAAEPGTRFYVQYDRRGQPEFAGTYFVWEIGADDGAQVEVKFDYPIGFAGDRSVSALDSRQGPLQYHEEVKGARNGNGYGMIVGAPFQGALQNDRSITIVKNDADQQAVTSTGARRILLAMRKADAAIDPDRIEPRTELIVGLDHTPRPLPWLHPRTAPIGTPSADGIRSAHITYRRALSGRGNLRPLSPGEVATIIDSADFNKNPDAAPEVLDQISSAKKQNWLTAEFTMDGIKAREKRGTEDLLCDGTWEMYRSVAHQQIAVSRDGDSPSTPRDYVSRFRLEAPAAPAEPAAAAERTLDVDPATKFVRRMTDGSPQTGTFSDSLQFAPKTYAPSQIFPRLALQALFRDGKLTTFEITIIDDVQINEPNNPENFLVFAAAGTHISIRSSDPVERRRTASPEEDVPDVIAYLREKNLLTDPKSQLVEAIGQHLFDGFDLVVHLSGRASLPEKLGQEIAKIEGVKQVVPGLLDVILLADAGLPCGTDPGDSPAAFLLGYAPDSPQVKSLNIQSDGRNLAVGDRKKILVGRNLAKRTGKRVGDEIRLYRSEKFQIVGIFFSTRPFENDSLIIPLAELQRLMNRPGEVTSFSVTANRPIDEKGLEALRGRLQSAQPGLEVSVMNKSNETAPNEKPDDRIKK